MKVKILRDKCISCMVCVATCPNIFQDKDGQVQILFENIPFDLEEICQEAVESCPIEAITLDRAGETSETSPHEIPQIIPASQDYSSLSGTNWYFAENPSKYMRQLVLEVQPGQDVPTKFGMLMLMGQYRHMIANTSATGFFSLDDQPKVHLLIRLDGYWDMFRKSPFKIGLTFFQTKSSGIVCVYVSSCSEELKRKVQNPNAFLEINYGLDEQRGVERMQKVFTDNELRIVLAGEGGCRHSLQNPSTGEFEDFTGPKCERDITMPLEEPCRQILSNEFKNIMSYHNSLNESNKNFQAGLNDVWNIMPTDENPILPRMH